MGILKTLATPTNTLKNGSTSTRFIFQHSPLKRGLIIAKSKMALLYRRHHFRDQIRNRANHDSHDRYKNEGVFNREFE